MDEDSGDENTDATEEVDELDSASNDETDAQQPQLQKQHISPTVSTGTASTPAVATGNAPPAERPKTKKRPKPATTRTPGTTMVPVNKVEAIVASDRE